MAYISITGLRKAYGRDAVLHGIDLEIGEREFVVLLGPSGCGKSTTLRLLAGLEEVSGGRIEIAGRDVTRLEPKERDIAMVFQNYALYPNMTVADNIGFGLKARRMPPAEIAAKVRAVAEVLGIAPLLGRRPRALSGGQQQRVAIGRAIVRDPRAFLFDEPLSNLDAALRVDMRTEILGLHRRLGATTIYVTHDQEEAMTMADRIVIMNAGAIEQVGTPEEIFFRPATRMVAEFIGSPRMNFLQGTSGAGDVLDTPLGRHAGLGLSGAGGALDVGVRPDDLVFVPLDGAAGQGAGQGAATPCEILLIEHLGPRAIVTFQTAASGALRAVVPHEALGRLRAADRPGVTVAPDRLHLFDPDSGRAIARSRATGGFG